MKGVTPYQLEILQHTHQIFIKTGRLADFDQVLKLLSWAPSKESAQFTVRSIIAKGLMVKKARELRRGRDRVLFELTPAGKVVLDPRPEPAVPEEMAARKADFIPGVSDDFVDLGEVLEG